MTLSLQDIEKIPKLIAEGKTNQAIADELGVHLSTVDGWIKKLRDANYSIPKRRPGRKPLLKSKEQ